MGKMRIFVRSNICILHI